MTNNITAPLSEEQISGFTDFVSSLNKEQITWVAGYLAGINAQLNQQVSNSPSTATPVNTGEKVVLTILYGSRTGNGEGLAKKAKEIAASKGLEVSLKNMADYKPKDLQHEKNLLVIVSTHGEGEPPFSAKTLHEFIYGNRAPKLDALNFAVLALGDSTYFHFCKTGKDFDEQLAVLGGKRIVPRIGCDVDFENAALEWLQSTIDTFAGSAAPTDNQGVLQYRMVSDVKPSFKTTEKFSKKKPFLSPVLEKVLLHGKGSDRQTIHIELNADAKGLEYEPGDAAAILPLNAQELIDEVIKITKIDSNEQVEIGGVKKTFAEALRRDVELSKITNDVIGRYLDFAPDQKLAVLRENPSDLKAYMEGRDIIDLMQDFPIEASAGEWILILRPLQPRYYSISSSPKANPGELHLTVGVVNFKNNGRVKHGACSTYLSEVRVENEYVPLYIESNPNFRLPEKEETPIIMVGAGTGIAPYRSFVQHRELAQNPGKSWLFFGNRNFETEFLYQTEWQDFIKTGALTRMDVAFSRDGEKKVYVQDRILEHSAEVFEWLQSGSHFYICGDMKKMAGDVQNALVQIAEKHGGMNTDAAKEYVDNLQKEKRLQLDVY